MSRSKEPLLEQLKEAPKDILNHWERTIVGEVLAQGHPLSNKELAEKMGIPRKQVKRVRLSMVIKMGLKKGL